MVNEDEGESLEKLKEKFEERKLKREMELLDRAEEDDKKRQKEDKKKNKTEFYGRLVGKDSGTWLLLLGFCILLIDTLIAIFYGRYYTGFQWVWDQKTANILMNLFQTGIFIVFMVIYGIKTIIKRNYGEGLKQEVWTYTLFAAVMTFFLTNHFWMGNLQSSVHLGFVLLFGFTFIRAHEDSTASWFWISLLLIIDFFGYPLFSKIEFLAYIPFWFFFVCFYIYTKTTNKWAIFFVILIFVFAVYVSLDTSKADAAQFSANEGGKSAWDGVKKAYYNFKESVVSASRRTLEQASGGYYKAKVEENKYEQLGVHLEGLKAAEPMFYTDEEIVVWGNVKARTLDEPVKVSVKCYIKDGENKIDGEIKGGGLDDGKEKEIATLEEESFDCAFDKTKTAKLRAGTYSVKVKATFNFETQSYLKTYFMDEERRRAMIREDEKVDILTKFGIKEKNPVSISTNGPIELGIGTKTPPTGLSTKTEAGGPAGDETWVGASIKNLWEGDVESLDELVILVPKEMAIGECSNREFIKYELSECHTNCDKKEEKQIEKCKESCNIIFGETEKEKFNGYRLNIDGIKQEIKEADEDIKNNQRFRSFRCTVNIPNSQEALGNTPITTKYFRATAKYNYSVEKSVGVVIRKDVTSTAPSTPSTLSETYVGKDEIQNKIISMAGSMNVPRSIALAVVEQESASFKHCTTDPCGTSNVQNVIRNSESYGIMQINSGERGHPELFIGGGAKKYGCGDSETAYDFECNIKCGLGILKEGYSLYANNDAGYNAAVNKYCNDSTYNGLYLSYKGWYRALRAYNGFRCNSDEGMYVEQVKEKMKKYQQTI